MSAATISGPSVRAAIPREPTPPFAPELAPELPEVSLETSRTIGKIALALSKAQGAMGSAKKDATGLAPDKGGGRRYGYASLDSVWDAVRGPLSANELAVVQTTEQAGMAGVCVVTTLAHSSGEWFRGRLWMPVRQQDAQGFGSALTYARRYALAAITGIAPADDDGASSVQAPRAVRGHFDPPTPPSPVAPTPEPLLTASQSARETYGPQFARVRSKRELDSLLFEVRRAMGSANPTDSDREWYFEMRDQTLAALGEPIPPRTSPVKAGSR